LHDVEDDVEAQIDYGIARNKSSKNFPKQDSFTAIEEGGYIGNLTDLILQAAANNSINKTS
jgi:hypothetical protein